MSRIDQFRYNDVLPHRMHAVIGHAHYHGADVIEPVWSLLEFAYQRFGVFPTLLERDFNFPPIATLLGDVERIRSLQALANDNAAKG